MKQLALLLGKIFIFTAVPFGVMMSACFIIPFLGIFFSGHDVFGFHMGAWIFLIFPVVIGSPFGILMTLILGLAHYFSVQKMAQGKPFDLSTIQSRTLVLKSNSKTIFENCVLALQ